MQQEQNMFATHLLLQELLNQSGQKPNLLTGYPNVSMYSPEMSASFNPLTRPLSAFQLPSLIPNPNASSNTQEHNNSSSNNNNYSSFQKYQPPTQSQTPKFTQASQQTIIAAPSVPIHKKRVLTPSQEVQFKREFALEIQCKQSLHRPKMREFVKKYSTPDCTFTWQQLERLLKRKREQTRRKNQKEVSAKPTETKIKEVKSEEPAQQLVDLRRPVLPSLPAALPARDAAPMLLSFSKNPNTPITLPKLPNTNLNEVKGAFQVGEEGKHALEQLRALAQLATNELKPELCTPKFPKCSPRRFDIFNLVNSSGRDSPTIAV